jgi:hypothetical protein
MASVQHAMAVVDDRPYFARAVRFGLDNGILTREDIARMKQTARKASSRLPIISAPPICAPISKAPWRGWPT